MRESYLLPKFAHVHLSPYFWNLLYLWSKRRTAWETVVLQLSEHEKRYAGTDTYSLCLASKQTDYHFLITQRDCNKIDAVHDSTCWWAFTYDPGYQCRMSREVCTENTFTTGSLMKPANTVKESASTLCQTLYLFLRESKHLHLLLSESNPLQRFLNESKHLYLFLSESKAWRFCCGCRRCHWCMLWCRPCSSQAKLFHALFILGGGDREVPALQAPPQEHLGCRKSSRGQSTTPKGLSEVIEWAKYIACNRSLLTLEKPADLITLSRLIG